ncbi:MAG TPA: M48 family metallopeptidase [Acidobacteriaceae bacterium]|jgi:predicted Zn-dependent protease
MKRYIPLVLILLAAAAGIAYIQRRHIDQQPSPQALLLAAADAQHELTRVPARFDRMSDADEIALGKELADHYSAWGATTPDAGHDAEVQAYLQTVGDRVTAHARRNLPWTFHYIPSPYFVNAFALPGGQVFVGEGLLKLMGSEDALAAVLGHEVEHVDLRHCAERAQTEARMHQFGVLGELAGLPMEIFMAGYSKEQEMEADRDGTTLAVEAGYSYMGILQLFGEFSHLENGGAGEAGKSAGPLGEAARLSLGTLVGYLSSHPPSTQRSESVRELADGRGWQAQPLKPLPAKIKLAVHGPPCKPPSC